MNDDEEETHLNPAHDEHSVLLSVALLILAESVKKLPVIIFNEYLPPTPLLLCLYKICVCVCVYVGKTKFWEWTQKKED